MDLQEAVNENFDSYINHLQSLTNEKGKRAFNGRDLNKLRKWGLLQYAADAVDNYSEAIDFKRNLKTQFFGEPMMWTTRLDEDGKAHMLPILRKLPDDFFEGENLIVPDTEIITPRDYSFKTAVIDSLKNLLTSQGAKTGLKWGAAGFAGLTALLVGASNAHADDGVSLSDNLDNIGSPGSINRANPSFGYIGFDVNNTADHNPFLGGPFFENYQTFAGGRVFMTLGNFISKLEGQFSGPSGFALGTDGEYSRHWGANGSVSGMIDLTSVRDVKGYVFDDKVVAIGLRVGGGRAEFKDTFTKKTQDGNVGVEGLVMVGRTQLGASVSYVQRHPHFDYEMHGTQQGGRIAANGSLDMGKPIRGSGNIVGFLNVGYEQVQGRINSGQFPGTHLDMKSSNLFGFGALYYTGKDWFLGVYGSMAEQKFSNSSNFGPWNYDEGSAFFAYGLSAGVRLIQNLSLQAQIYGTRLEGEDPFNNKMQQNGWGLGLMLTYDFAIPNLLRDRKKR
ncbi:hypothetical protein ACFLZB_03780 [Nanoarchaeota archaeon]